MIHITVYKNEKHECMGFCASGHAGFARSGQDIVCSAVSVLVINTINAIGRFTEDAASEVSNEEEGRIEFRLGSRPSHDASLLLKAMILGLEGMAADEEYGKYIDVDFEEV